MLRKVAEKGIDAEGESGVRTVLLFTVHFGAVGKGPVERENLTMQEREESCGVCLSADEGKQDLSSTPAGRPASHRGVGQSFVVMGGKVRLWAREQVGDVRMHGCAFVSHIWVCWHSHRAGES